MAEFFAKFEEIWALLWAYIDKALKYWLGEDYAEPDAE